MHAHDIPAVLAIQTECYAPHMNESEAVIRRRLDAAPDTAWVVELAGEVVAYLVGYRSRFGKVTALGGCFETPTEPDCLYLHDLAAARRARGKGVAAVLVQRAFEFARAQRLNYSALVSVQDSRRFWERFGYRSHEILSFEQARALESYQVPCWYMVFSPDQQATPA